MENTNKPILPRLSRFVGKVIAESGVGLKEATVAGARGSARLAGQCAREFLEGLKDGKAATDHQAAGRKLDEVAPGAR